MPDTPPTPETVIAGAVSPCCAAEVVSDPVGFHCGHCGIPLYERSPYAD